MVPMKPLVDETALAHAEGALRAAMATLRRLPRGRDFRPSTRVTLSLPELAGLVGSEDEPARRHRPIAPSPGEIDSMDRVLQALLPLDSGQRRLLAARGCGASFRRLAEHFGQSHTTLRRRHQQALAALVPHLRHPELPEGMDW